MLQRHASVPPANWPLKRLASCLCLDAYSTSQTQMKPLRNASLPFGTSVDTMHKGCEATSQFSSIALSVLKLTLTATYLQWNFSWYPIRLCWFPLHRDWFMDITNAIMICNQLLEISANACVYWWVLQAWLQIPAEFRPELVNSAPFRWFWPRNYRICNMYVPDFSGVFALCPSREPAVLHDPPTAKRA